jgi:hypothetical protein
MEDLIGFILELLFDVLLQVIFEEGVATVSRTGRLFRLAPFIRATLSRANPPLKILKFTILGVVLGLLSLLIFPRPLVHPSRLHGVSLLISPVISGLIMSFVGRVVRRRGKAPVQIESFTYGFTFALAMALIRFLSVR